MEHQSLLLSFHKLGDDIIMERLAKRDDRRHDISAVFVVYKFTNKRPIQLNGVKRIFLQIHQRAVPHAEIVHRQLDAQFPDACDSVLYLVASRKRRLLGYFNFKRLAIDPDRIINIKKALSDLWKQLLETIHVKEYGSAWLKNANTVTVKNAGNIAVIAELNTESALSENTSLTRKNGIANSL